MASISDPALEALQRLAAEAGVVTTFVDALGTTRRTPPEPLVAVLAALGVPIASVAEAPDALAEFRAHRTRRPVPPVVVAWDDDPLLLPVSTREPPSRVRVTVITAGGARVSWIHGEVGDPVVAVPAGAPHEPDVDGVRGTGGWVLPIRVPPEVDWGCHRLVVEADGLDHSGWLLRAPRRVHPGPLADDARLVGAFLPLYAAWSDRSWGMGDLGDLEHLGRWAARQDLQVVATLPLLAAFLDEPLVASPYSPVSRRFWNEAYLDLDRLDPALWTPEAARLAATSAPELRADRGPLVDLERVTAAKTAVLEAMLPPDRVLPSALADELATYRRRVPDVVQYGRFRAAGAAHGRDWRSWPVELRYGRIPDGAVDEGQARYHEVVQWLVDRQLGQTAGRMRERGVSLYLDLPLGGHPDGFDSWADQDLLATGMSLGAPPDVFFPRGQVWGLPPTLPDAGHHDGYAGLSACLDHHLAVADLLRLDHVMAMHRCYWIPAGADAGDGAYVRYPSQELAAVVSAASHRHASGIVGEDLGTVPHQVRELLETHGLYGMYVAEFEVTDDPRVPVSPPSRRMVASLATHDLPTFTAWWAEADIDDRIELGLLGTEAEAGARADRRRARRTLATAVDVDPDDRDVPTGLVAQDHLLAKLAASDAPLVLVDVESLWGETEPQNVPGTSVERPNWRRRARHSLDELEQLPQVRRRFAPIAPRPPAAPGRPDELITADDQYLFNEGRHFGLHDKLGAQVVATGQGEVVHMAVWAPNAFQVSVIGDFNGWDETRHRLEPVGSSGIWAGLVPEARPGDAYKYRIWSRHGGYRVDKADPFAFAAEVPPATASRVWAGHHEWGDERWMAERWRRQGPGRPMSIYEVHLGSWRRSPDDPSRPLGYRELAPQLAEHCVESGFTHVELMPIMEHPFYGSWGYQVTGFFAPTSRYGPPEDLMFFVDTLHQAGVGVILDWVPSHFPADEHGLGFFDGTHLYEHADIRQRVHPEWQSLQFNYGRHEVRSFLISNAMFWLERFHADGLRVDAVASMLYLDYGRQPGEWVPNRYGGNENLDAVQFLQELNTAVYGAHPDTVMIAEESTAWGGVTAPAHVGGLGFGYKWDLGWMHDTLSYLHRDPIHRRWHHHELTFRSLYQNAEHYVLPLSHDEVVHGKGSLLGRMPGDDWQQFANLRLLYGYQHTAPGSPLLFMGEEFAPRSEWDHERSLHWHLLDSEPHAGVARWVAHLNHLVRATPALYELDREPAGFEWVDADDADRSVYTYLRRADGGTGTVLVALNATPVPRNDVVVGVPDPGRWVVVANSDDPVYGGSGYPVPVDVHTTGWGAHGRPEALVLTLAPLSAMVLRHGG